ncbi:Actin, alpha skeletal muscle [Saxophila tyrrhenica]|uniref:Actin, alpha skeletal muscle n=1 Tax=Saxophila tyrrhenica TaxID=1690608 RepID=A0AAV9PJA4_9PEZI|nr:Actin, alpha skeletal muscle [Saxophila tyrrhenica]
MVLITELTGTDNSARETKIQYFFDTLNSHAFYLASREVLALFSTNRTTGLVVYFGDSVASVIPVNEGCAVKDAVSSIEVAGGEITDAAGLEGSGVAQAVQNSISGCDVNIKKDLFKNIVLVGNVSSSAMSGFMEEELRKAAQANQKLSVEVPQDPQNAAWRGGSILGEQSSFRNSWVTKAACDEQGAAIVHKKCL